MEKDLVSTSIFYPSILQEIESGEPLKDISDRYGVPIGQVKVIYDKFDCRISKLEVEMVDIFSRLDKLENSNKFIIVSGNK